MGTAAVCFARGSEQVVPVVGIALGGLVGTGAGPVIQPTPNPTGPVPSYLTAVSCASASSCTAVGYGVTETGADAALSEVWSGTAWTVEPVASPAGSTASTFRGVSCPSISSCFAVGQDKGASGVTVPLVEHWDGTAWSVQTSPIPRGVTGASKLSGIDCPTASSCFAVGYYVQPGSRHELPLAEHWNSARWSIERVPHPRRTVLRELNAVSCPSPSSCIAVGRANGSTLAEHWDGRKWSTELSANPPGRAPPTLQAVSCLSPSSCTAVGYHTDTDGVGVTLAEHWDGRHWKVQPTNVAFGSASVYFEGVFCTSRSSCFAVGYANEVGTLIEHWDGTSWSLTASPTANPGDDLAGISCVSGHSCFAAGQEKVFPAGHVTLVEQWSGSSWTAEKTPNVTGPQSSQLFGISCPSAVECIAVGSYYGASGVTSLVEQWNGASWSVRPTPREAGGRLQAVACASASSCVAVGAFEGGSLVGHWNGGSWTVQPNGSRARDDLWSVSCPSLSTCVAVGNVAASWNGTSWRFVSFPKPYLSSDAVLTGVSCPTTTSCVAVGSARHMLVEQWNGTRWSIERAHHPKGATYTSLASVSCPTPSTCSAVGYFEGPTATAFTLVERWNGTIWSPAASPNPAGSSILRAVSCGQPMSCTAVGSGQSLGGVYTTLAERL